MIILGITGAIGMGKTTVAEQFASFGVPVFDADEVARELLRTDEKAITMVKAMFPDSVNGDIDRVKLANIVFHSKVELKKLESILHPMIRDKMETFIEEHSDKKTILLDVPLLFQTGWNTYCDYTIRVKAPRFIQKIRVMKRPHMTREKMDEIIKLQKNGHMSDFTIQTGWGSCYSMRCVRRILDFTKQDVILF